MLRYRLAGNVFATNTMKASGNTASGSARRQSRQSIDRIPASARTTVGQPIALGSSRAVGIDRREQPRAHGAVDVHLPQLGEVAHDHPGFEHEERRPQHESGDRRESCGNQQPGGRLPATGPADVGRGDGGKRHGEDRGVVVRRNREAGEETGHGPRPPARGSLWLSGDARQRGQRQRRKERHRHVELHVVRVANGQRRHGQQQRRRQTNRRSSDAPAEEKRRRHGCGSDQRGEQPGREHVPGRVDEERVLERGQRREPSETAPHHEVERFPREDRVEVQRRIEEVVRVGVAFGEGERAIENRALVHVEDARQPVVEIPHAQSEGEQRDCGQRRERPA